MLRSSLLLLGAALVVRSADPTGPADPSGTAPPHDRDAATSADVDFATEIRPILDARCASCHGEKKSKGRLRFDRKGTVFKDRDGYAVVVPGDPDASELMKRITLPPEDFDVMPPEEPFLTKAEIELFRQWIAEGAEWPEPGEEPAPKEEEAQPESLDVAAVTGEARERVEAALAALEERGALALPIANGANAIDVNFALLRESATDADLALLDGLEPVLVWLQLARSEVTDDGLRTLARFGELRRLQLPETAVGDAGLAHLAKLPKLEVLNLFGTKVTDAGLAHLAGIASLKRVYLWRTEVTEEGAAALRQRRPDLTVDLGWTPPPPEPKKEATFENVQPILAGNCFACHGPDEATRKAGLRLDTFDGATAELPSGNRGIVPGAPEESAVLQRVLHGDENVRMPPAEFAPRLTQDEIDLLKRWIEGGAEFAEHWSFQPPADVTPPKPDPSGDGETIGALHPIDAFVRARLNDEGLAPSPRADRYTLARRLSLDLRGLPARASEIEAFVHDDAEGAYERLVERFLADPAFGERWATSWLDLARYADTKGYESDRRRTIWPYRDWVIRALNDDLPFDRFTILQLAGDLLPEAERDDDALVATAFHRNTMTNDEGGTDDEEFRTAAVVDRVNTTMQVWMGLTFACAQCHSHKYDPITQREYYEVLAVFNQTEDADRPDEAPVFAVASPEERAELARLEAFALDADAELERSTRLAEERFPAWLADHLASPPTAPTEELEVALPNDAALRSARWLDGDAATAPGITGRAVLLDGTRALDLGEAADFERDQPFTYALWMRREGDQVHVPLARMDAGDAFRGWDLYVVGGQLVVHLIHAWPADALRVETFERIPDRSWTHVAVSYDGSSKASGLHVYVDGQRVATNATHDALTGTTRTVKSLLVGRRHGGESMTGLVDGVRVYRRALADEEVARLARADVQPADPALRIDLLQRLALRTDEARNRALATRAEAQASLAHVRDRLPRVPVMRELPADARRQTHVLARGSFLNPTEPVEAGVPAALHPIDVATPDRLAFARWLVSDDNPLTARVQVNRLWGELFGTGLVETQEDFGTQGARPSHPTLLDWLARDFVRSGWSWKALVRRVVTSETYRQASDARPVALAQDPRNRLLWRGPRHRLDAEMIRDQALFAAGLLSLERFGPPVFPPQPDGVWQVIYNGDAWATAEGPDRWRRGLYTFWRRTSPYPSMTTFDVPSREVCVSRRIRTNTPLQALVTLNDPVFVEAAQALARRIVTSDAADDRERIARAFLWTVGRPAEARELDALLALVASEREHYAARDEDAVLLAGSEEPDDAAELAAWTVVGNVLLNLDEVLVKG